MIEEEVLIESKADLKPTKVEMIEHNEDYANYCVIEFIKHPEKREFFLEKIANEIIRQSQLRPQIAKVLQNDEFIALQVQNFTQFPFVTLESEIHAQFMRIFELMNEYPPIQPKKLIYLPLSKSITDFTFAHINELSIDLCQVLTELLKLCIHMSQSFEIQINPFEFFINTYQSGSLIPNMRYFLLNIIGRILFLSDDLVIDNNLQLILDITLKTITDDFQSCYSTLYFLTSTMKPIRQKSQILQYIHYICDVYTFDFMNKFLNDYIACHKFVINILMLICDKSNYEDFRERICSRINWNCIPILSSDIENTRIYLKFIKKYMLSNEDLIPIFFESRIIDSIMEIINNDLIDCSIRDYGIYIIMYNLPNFSLDQILHVFRNGLCTAICDVGLISNRAHVEVLADAFTIALDRIKSLGDEVINEFNNLFEENMVFDYIEDILNDMADSDELEPLQELFDLFKYGN